ncbi:glucan biosynthesis protein D [Microbaculum marinum]|uniref:Glucan biosynthesis protein D n=1 Tax=Microbaculum marinum TaxID=1764581 RepID=A0AAW9S247_9HYPH
MVYTLTRRELLIGGVCVGAAGLLPRLALATASAESRFGPAEPFSFDLLKRRARELAGKPYAAPVIRAPEVLEQIDFDAHQQIRFRDEAQLWGGDGGGPGIGFFHLGRYFKAPVRIYAVEGGEARELLYSPDHFEMPEGHVARNLPEDIGFAGFRVMDESGKSDWLAVLGASYFRTSGPFGQYGLSARGIAVDTASSKAEEFPRFSEFWLERTGDGGLILYALLDGPSLSGAYRIAGGPPDKGIVQDVEAALFTRTPIEKLGIAPLTSMFWYSETNREDAKDWRPEIHDSDGLAIWTGAGERIWRPITNPPIVTTNAFVDENPRGFGLLQRDRDFENYQDDGVFYEKRASVWVEPNNDWGAGSVQLVEIPTDDEIHDNIVAFWVPREPVAGGQALDFSYRLHWLAAEPHPAPIAQVVATRIGMGGIPGQPRPPGARKFAIDLEGPTLAGLDRQSGVTAAVESSRGKIDNTDAYPVVGTDRWRVLFDIEAQGHEPVTLRMYLRQGGDALSETWIYQYFPAAVV